MVHLIEVPNGSIPSKNGILQLAMPLTSLLLDVTTGCDSRKTKDAFLETRWYTVAMANAQKPKEQCGGGEA